MHFSADISLQVGQGLRSLRNMNFWAEATSQITKKHNANMFPLILGLRSNWPKNFLSFFFTSNRPQDFENRPLCNIYAKQLFLRGSRGLATGSIPHARWFSAVQIKPSKQKQSDKKTFPFV